MPGLKKPLLVTLLLMVCLSIAWAENDIILEIKVLGNQNIDRDLVLSVIPMRLGDSPKPDAIAKSIRNLYQLGVFEDINIDIDTLEQGVVVTVNLLEFPIVEKVIFEGNDELSEGELEDITGVRKGSYWSPYLRAELRSKILKAYSEKNYHHAKVDFNTSDAEKNRVDLRIVVEEGSEITIKAIRFHGNKEITASDLTDEMEVKKRSLFRSGQFDQTKFDTDLDKIITFYNTEGYIDARILKWEKNIENDEDMVIDIFLNEGEKFYFGRVISRGNIAFDNEMIASHFKFTENEIFSMEKFQKQLQGVSSMYYEEGYIYSQFNHELQKDGNKLNIVLNIKENNRARIHKIVIKGNHRTKEKIIRRQLAIAPGDYFSQSKVMQTQQRIYNLGFFEADLRPDYEAINENGDIDLVIPVTDRMSGSVNGGVGYNSQDNFVGQFSLSQDNLFGNSWKIQLSTEFGGSTENFEADFTNPYLYDTNTLGGVSLAHTTKKWSSFNYQVMSDGGSVRIGRPLSFLNYSQFVLSYAFSAKKYEILDTDDSYSSYIEELDATGWQYNSSISATLSRDSRDNVFFPKTGTQFTLYNEIAGGPLGGDFDYFKQITEFRWFVNLYWDLVLRNKWRIGYVTAYGNSDEVPPEERFYLGGTGVNGIRGFGDRSIGPDDGGHRAAIFSSELGFPIAGDDIVALAFFDAGNAFDRLEEFNLWKMKKGTGLGIRIRSPFGLIGFDYAYNLEEDKWEPHFQFGTTF